MKALYVHIPFCRKRCRYCSFNVFVSCEKYVERYLSCLEKEIRQRQGEEIKTIYWGGGTPSFLSEPQIERLAKNLQRQVEISEEAEWTIEVNPEDVTLSKAKCIKSLGINRVSIGVQTFNDKFLAYLGRPHDKKKALASIQSFKKIGVDNVSMDLMFGFPEQTMREIERDIDILADLGLQHISLYSLSIDVRSRFYVQKIAPLNGSLQAEQYAFVKRLLEKKGFVQYEISNFSLLGRESRHNMNYWEEGEYFGLGAGAHSFINGRRVWNIGQLKKYMSCIESGLPPIEGEEKLSPLVQFKEAFLLGLRMNKGVNHKELSQRYGCSFSSLEEDKIKLYIRKKLLRKEKDCIRTTDRGQLVLDEICAQLI